MEPHQPVAVDLEAGARAQPRVAAAIPSGVGFLGAGLIWKMKVRSPLDPDGPEHEQIHGLTTAASTWVAASVGIAAGGAMYFVAVFAVLTLFAATLYVTGIPLFTPAIPILLMQCVPPNRRGAVMGLDSAVNAVARIATPIILGKVYHASPAAAFASAGAIVACACALVLVRRWMVMGPGAKFGGVGSAR